MALALVFVLMLQMLKRLNTKLLNIKRYDTRRFKHVAKDLFTVSSVL